MASERCSGRIGAAVLPCNAGRYPTRRWSTTVAAGLLAAGILTSCGGNATAPSHFSTDTVGAPPTAAAGPATTESPGPPVDPAATTKPKPPPSTNPPARARGVRLGCGTYCQAAGILNGGLGDGQPAVTIVPSGTATADADGYVPVVLTCNLKVQCQGSLVLILHRPGFQDQGYVAGRSDVVANVGATTTLDVPLNAVALDWLRSHGPTELTGVVDAGLSFGCDGSVWAPDIPTPTGLPACGTGDGAPVVNGFAVSSGADLIVAAPE